MSLNELQTLADHFLSRVFKELERNRFELEEHWHIDHLCFRTSSQENYLYTKKQFENFSQFLIESEINGRPISTFKLYTPISFAGWTIDLIEVPAPKKEKPTVNGFEHIEVVCDLTFNEIQKRYNHCQFDESGLNKNFNQELKVCFEDFSVKFHHLSLESVINLEAHESVFSALNSSNILSDLRPLSPLIAGTFPLNINCAGSDIDILISEDDLSLMKKTVTEKFAAFHNFDCREILVQNEPTLFTSFSYQNVKFEIFGQKTTSLKQRAYLHFLIEERLLKLGGPLFTAKVKEARRQELKTEPAFAKVLGLDGDPYQELLLLQKKNNHHLMTLLQKAIHV
jgi:uncharacterized protein